MSADLLREAAVRMRERAEGATPGPWEPYVLGSEGYLVREAHGQPRPGSRIPRPVRVARCGLEDWDTDKANAHHIAGMDPAVALAVADWLAECARLWEYGDVGPLMWKQALAVARVYLGRDA